MGAGDGWECVTDGDGEGVTGRGCEGVTGRGCEYVTGGGCECVTGGEGATGGGETTGSEVWWDLVFLRWCFFRIDAAFFAWAGAGVVPGVWLALVCEPPPQPATATVRVVTSARFISRPFDSFGDGGAQVSRRADRWADVVIAIHGRASPTYAGAAPFGLASGEGPPREALLPSLSFRPDDEQSGR